MPDTAVDWTALKAVREPVKKVLEELRVAGKIGSGLNAEVALYADGAAAEALRAVGDELRFWFITSAATIAPLAAKPAHAVAASTEGGPAVFIADRKSTRLNSSH